MKDSAKTTIVQAAQKIQRYENGDLTARIAELESLLKGSNLASYTRKLGDLNIDSTLLDSALTLKRVAGQINVIIHSVGVLLALPHILTKEEVVESLSLGAGNTGKAFDLETNIRVAEFKFINWRGADSVRQNSLFKDFFYLAECDTPKVRNLFVTGMEQPLKFLNGGRALRSVMSQNNGLWRVFQNKYGDRFERVRDYYEYRKEQVVILDLSDIIPSFDETLAPDMNDEE